MATKAPESLDELRHLYIRIRNGEHETRLTDRTLGVLKRMLDEPNETAAKSISEIARENDINISSITRLSQKLGFDGFPALKALFRNRLKERKRFYSEQVIKFLEKGAAGTDGESTLLERVIQDEWGNVMLMTDAFDDRRFAAIIRLLVDAGRVLVIGLRSSYPMAHYLGFYLKMIRDRVTVVGQAGHTLAEDLSVLEPGDLLVAISVHPYTSDTYNACLVGRRKGADIVAVTDSLSSPLIAGTDHFIITSTVGDYFFSPIAATVICIETLLSELVKRLGDKAIRRLRHAESVLEEMGTEI